jgi:hypothetical protein
VSARAKLIILLFQGRRQKEGKKKDILSVEKRKEEFTRIYNDINNYCTDRGIKELVFSALEKFREIEGVRTCTVRLGILKKAVPFTYRLQVCVWTKQ